MKKLTVDEIKKIELDILVDVTDFCEQKNLDYFISCGTLLGAVRHKGFIPWDDDIDITMPRDSYEKFISTYRSEKDYKLVSIYNSVKYNRRFARVMSMKTCRSTHKTVGYDYRVCIDVFPMDFFNSEQQFKDTYQYLFPERNKEQGEKISFSKLKETVKKSIVLPVARYVLTNVWALKQLPTANRNARRRDRYVQDNSGQKGRFVSSVMAPMSRMPEIFRYSEIFPTSQTGRFEGHMFRVPNNADRYLTALYGDYMKPLAAEKRNPYHYKEAYIKE